MKDKKKHKLLIISPAGEEYQIGFLSPCKDGYVLGTSQNENGERTHLTILHKKGTISAHITLQRPSKEKQYQDIYEPQEPTAFKTSSNTESSVSPAGTCAS